MEDMASSNSPQLPSAVIHYISGLPIRVLFTCTRLVSLVKAWKIVSAPNLEDSAEYCWLKWVTVRFICSVLPVSALQCVALCGYSLTNEKCI